MHALESNSNSHSLINTILSKKALTECSRPKNINNTLSKQSNFEIVPRITRRMHKQMSSNQSLNDKCAICLNNFSNDQGYLECGHMFCMVCLIRWWRNHNTCPYCRKEILFIRNRQNQITYKSELPPLQKNEDEKFIANCQLCWGEIESNQPMNICTQCRCVYWHSRCLPFTSNRWYCTQCAQLERQPEQQQIEE